MQFSEDIEKILKERYPDKDIYNMSLDELKLFREEIEDLRHEYFLLEIGSKLLGNGLYGACANEFFYFFNVNLAGDITGECRHLTKTMWNNMEEFFHETIWNRKDLWERFDFALDESKHDWCREQTISCYSDTDSTFSKALLNLNNGQKEITIEKLFDEQLKINGLTDVAKYGQEIVKCSDCSILNYTKDKGMYYAPIKYVIRHKVTKQKFKIKAKSSKEIIVTGDHSCIVFRDGKQIIIKAKDINIKTDKILSVNHIFSYIIEDIESIKQLGNFEDEYVYDIEVDDASHSFIANDILVHNSVYVTYEPLFESMTKEYQKKYGDKELRVNWMLKFNTEFMNNQNNQWCRDIYDPRHGKNVHEFELETIQESQIVLTKKHYLKGTLFSKGKFYLDHPKVSGTGIELIKSTTPKLARKILKDLMESLMFEYDVHNKSDYIDEFMDKLTKYKNDFYTAPLEDISQSVGVGNYKKFVIEDKDKLELAKGCPVSVQSIARYNYLAHQNGQDNLITYSGKIKYYNILLSGSGKKAVYGYFGFPAGELPVWAPKMDKRKQFEKTIIDPINRFLTVMNIPEMNPDLTYQISLFDL